MKGADGDDAEPRYSERLREPTRHRCDPEAPYTQPHDPRDGWHKGDDAGDQCLNTEGDPGVLTGSTDQRHDKEGET